jgi:DNA repair protein SbcD/Mre11
MKILHTSDWHLGQKFISREREEEHRLALDWLAKTVTDENIDLLIVAGDVFDIGNPPNYARALYYGFFKKLRHSNCRHIVVTAGNHDSPHMLDAPREILQLLDIHVVGAATEDPAGEVLVLNNEKGEPEAVVAAVPFLRDQDLRRAVSGETGQDRIERIKEGILAHYEAVGRAAEEYKKLKIPIIATGHLYATGAEASGKQDNIYLGNLENIRVDQFPRVFDYVALGHIHRAQAVGGAEHVRYSGSLIPLSFSETKDDKAVTVVEFQKDNIKSIRDIPAPTFRRLKTIEGSLAEVQERLERLHEKYKDQMPAWVEVIVDEDAIIPNLNGLMQDFVREMNLDLLRVKWKKMHNPLDEQLENEELEDLLPVDVFRKKCESAGRATADVEELVAVFRELEDWVREKENR